MEFSEEKLISEVQARPALYAKDMNGYKNANKRKNLWKEVALEVGQEVDFCKKRWRSLRDTFIKVYKTVENTSSGAAGAKKKSWSYYEMMTFIIPHIESREAFGNYSQSQQQDTSTIEVATEEDETVVVALECDDATSTKSNQSGTSEYGVNTAQSRYSFTKQRKRMHDSVDEILNKILCKEDDPDEHFLLSLLPSLRRLNPQQNALAKMKILQLLYEIEFTDSSRSTQPFPNQ